MGVKRISSSYYPVSDMSRSLAFYRDTLGLVVKFQDGDKWTQFDVGGQALAIATPAPQQPDPGEGAVVVLECDDLSAMREHLLQQGLAPSEPVAMGGHGRFFTVRDPDGNLVQCFARN